jgi:hypothetical protein
MLTGRTLITDQDVTPLMYAYNEKPEQTNSGVKIDRIEKIELRTLCRK